MAPIAPIAEARVEHPAAPAPVIARAPLSSPPAAASTPAPAAPAPATAKSSNGIPVATDGDLKSYLFAIVSEKTGYPVEILNLDQQLEADLGIDSIKRVEILSAFEGQIPDIKDVNLEEVTKLATLRDVLGFMERYADKLGLTKKKRIATRATEPVAAADPASPLPGGVTRHAPAFEAAPPGGFALPGLWEAGRIEVVEDDRGFAQAIARGLVSIGVDARSVSEVSPDAAGVVFARGLSNCASADAATALHRDALHAARTLANRPGRRVFVMLQDTGGDFGLSGRAATRAWTGGLAGIAKTAAGEWPESACRAIDIDTVSTGLERVAERVVRELLLGGSDMEVGLDASGRRGVVRHRAAAYTGRRGVARIRPGQVILVSGGARGVTAAALAALCRHRPRFALLGRTALVHEPAETRSAPNDAAVRRALLEVAKAKGAPVAPKELVRQAKLILDCREIRTNVASLESAGAEVTYHAVDVRNARDVKSVVDAIRAKWGPVGGLIHGAGVLADAALSAQTDEQFDLVFGTKVDGLRHLLDAVADDPLEVLVLFSSVAGRFGNSGQAAYSMANEVLSCVAAAERARRGSRCVVRSLAWGPWAGGMVTPGLAKLFERAGVQLLPLDAGAEALAREIESDDAASQVVLMSGEPPLVAKPLHGGKAPSGEEHFDICVNATTSPYLEGHRIKGIPVVPAVLVLEWFLRAARVYNPALVPTVCRDLKVLRGIPVEDFEGAGMNLVVRIRQTEGQVGCTTFEAKLVDRQERPRYAAVIEMAAVPSALTGDLPGIPAGEQPWKWSVESAYRDVLFHRGPFAAIRSLGFVSDTGASGEVVGLHDLGWVDRDWLTDVAMMDGGVQIAVLWGAHVLGALPLPTRIGSFHLQSADGPLPAGARVRCFLRGRRVGQHRAVADVAYVDGRAAVIGFLQDVDLHMPAGSEPPPAAASER
jgi:hypothetical protein